MPQNLNRPGHGLPRIRGDRPSIALLLYLAFVATPHTRGSTVTGRVGAGSRGATPHTRGSTHVLHVHTLPPSGYPAYAGIDPASTNAMWGCRWLPRIRGDRPCPCQLVHFAGRATPHTRGSTHLHRQEREGVEGYPAYAGIDLYFLTPPRLGVRLPRIRGDRPKFGVGQPQCPEATPHTRGSTSLARYHLIHTHGYPAYAGIDPLGR